MPYDSRSSAVRASGHSMERLRLALSFRGRLFQRVAIAGLITPRWGAGRCTAGSCSSMLLGKYPIACADSATLACEKGRFPAQRGTCRGTAGTVTSLLDQLASCLGSHKICGVVYDNTQPYAHILGRANVGCPRRGILRGRCILRVDGLALVSAIAWIPIRVLPRSDTR